MTRPFEGIRIIDITHVLAGPFAAYQLAVLGADVITGKDLKAVNTFDAQSTVVPSRLDTPRPASEMTFELPPRSYSVVRMAR